MLWTYRSRIVIGVFEKPEVHAIVFGEKLGVGRQRIEAIAQLWVARIARGHAQVKEASARLHILGMIVLLPALAAVIQAVHK